jgi:RNA polymerase sigma-70 factor (ECF subfamily)
MTASWLERSKRGDDEAWDRLDRVYRRLVCWWCLKSEIPARDVDDVVQDVFVAVARGLATYEHKSFLGWLWTITKRRIQDYWRHRNEGPIGLVGSTIEETLAYVEGESSSTVDQATKIVFDAIVSLVRSEFSDEDWHAFWSVVVEGKPPVAVAKELGVTRNKVYLAKSRILRRIREVFGGEMHPERAGT